MTKVPDLNNEGTEPTEKTENTKYGISQRRNEGLAERASRTSVLFVSVVASFLRSGASVTSRNCCSASREKAEGERRTA
jgi:hypothetical protein